jgi:phosphoribosylformimino-5-aminoimidazole carboxamide ribotide isomerase
LIAIPAVDLRQGTCVQLVGGDYAEERVRLPDPVLAAVEWERVGFAMLHVADLDAATGRGSNAEIVREIISAVKIPVQVGGGIRGDEELDDMLGIGAARVVVGTRALVDPAWLERAALRLPGQIVVAADVRIDRVLTHGWSREHEESLDHVLARLAQLPLAGLLVTAVHREGRVAGPDLDLTRRCVKAGQPLLASGGIASQSDLEELENAGAAGAVIGMAIYTGALNADETAKCYGVRQMKCSSGPGTMDPAK